MSFENFGYGLKCGISIEYEVKIQNSGGEMASSTLKFDLQTRVENLIRKIDQSSPVCTEVSFDCYMKLSNYIDENYTIPLMQYKTFICHMQK